ncbi:MAG: phospho-N-acetylmuramoyl-pentapeptide-transferase, partial [Oscillospiraceae bacterium]|nr:phospho-N-acetylmuramoyl-pentapeptide-transferase [Oscillospiraceae bacterium]
MAHVQAGYPHHGGIIFIGGMAASMALFCWRDLLAGDPAPLFVLVFALVFGVIGFVDDYAKIRKRENTGLTAGWKFLLQLAAAIAFLALLRSQGMLSANLYIP